MSGNGGCPPRDDPEHLHLASPVSGILTRYPASLHSLLIFGTSRKLEKTRIQNKTLMALLRYTYIRTFGKHGSNCPESPISVEVRNPRAGAIHSILVQVHCALLPWG